METKILRYTLVGILWTGVSAIFDFLGTSLHLWDNGSISVWSFYPLLPIFGAVFAYIIENYIHHNKNVYENFGIIFFIGSVWAMSMQVLLYYNILFYYQWWSPIWCWVLQVINIDIIYYINKLMKRWI